MNEISRLNGKKLFITGGTGFFGKNLLESLLKEHSSAEITILSRNPEQFSAAYPHFQQRLNLAFIKGDIREFPFPSGSFDYFIHGAADADAALIREHPEEMYSVIVDGTRHLLDFAGRSPSPRLLYLSSGAVYGHQPDDLPHIPETYSGRPENAYGQGKLDAENLCLKSGVTCCIARGFAFSGNYLPLNKHYALGNFISDVLHNRPILVKGDGRTIRSYLDSKDLCRWLWSILLNAPDREIFNVGSDRPISIKELAETVRRISGKQLPVTIQKEWDGLPPQRYVPDVAKANAFGLKQTVTLEKSLENMIYN